MPTSDYYNISPILAILNRIDPKSVLDVGCGFGKYGVLIREYFDVARARLTRDQWQVRLVGIEAFPGYRNVLYESVYNEVHYGEAQAVLPTLGNFDVILMADVIEHLDETEAVALVRESLAHSPLVVISTPREFHAQDGINGNPYEIHRNHFTLASFPAGAHVRAIRAVGCWIFVAGREPLPESLFELTDPADHLYLFSRVKLGWAGLPIAAVLRRLNRWFS
jgi:2-polyprenyl-3-methyl-5-hydroxy-6-metoxy-1,4-benzoquinol methylase